VLLVGGDHYDYRNHSNSGGKSFIPSLYVPIANNVKSVPSDASLVLMDDDLVPDMTIARLPVRSTQELANLVNKRQRYLARANPRTAVFAADERDHGDYSFKADAQQLVNQYFQGWQVNEVYLDDAALTPTRSALVSTLNSGVSLVSYFGHSSTDRWSVSGLLSGDDVGGLSNNDSPMVVAQWGCWNTFYVDAENDSMAHRFLLDGEQGTVTVMGATSFTKAVAEKRMAGYLFANLQQGMRIGDAVLAAKRQLAQQTPYQADVLLGWAVLGFDDMSVFE